MPDRTSPTGQQWQFQRSVWDSDYLPAIMLSCWGGFMWSLIALFASFTWDIDQSWYDSSPVHTLPLKIALLWPVWGAVQAETMLAALGWRLRDGVFLASSLLGIVPLLALSAMWAWRSNHSQA